MTRSPRWKVAAEQINPGNIGAYFRRKTDLFAFHAYPVVKRDLGPGATETQVLGRIEGLLDGLSNKERQQWKDSFEKLQQGNMKMLSRGPSRAASQPSAGANQPWGGIDGRDELRGRSSIATSSTSRPSPYGQHGRPQGVTGMNEQQSLQDLNSSSSRGDCIMYGDRDGTFGISSPQAQSRVKLPPTEGRYNW
ncbi:hypothetical protein EJ04DRAFT_214018 [Polyplosphaeria fusca]|uniref:Uncharacterized protein n=1 Tax=Polyplosphaeria fusca TaxID=682080 RepID=A0A9P4R7W9_9PLEO|nr:hypothetical protein EJ04DRAFT_214018 [Polyplosphaeria fusca]